MVNPITESTPLSQRIDLSRFHGPANPIPLSYKLLQALLHVQVAYLLFIIWSREYSYFLWHPTLMLLFYYLMTQAISQYKAFNSYDLSQRRKIHAIIQHLSVASLLGAAAIVFTYKSEKHVPHYNAFHPILGLIIVIMVFISGIAAYAVYFTPNMFSNISSLLATISFHRYMGFAIYTLTTLNIVTGLDYAFDISNSNQGFILYPLIVLVYTITIFHQLAN